jgi:hypothetical protein
MQAERPSNRGFCSPGVLQFTKLGHRTKLSAAVALVALPYFYAGYCIQFAASNLQFDFASVCT